MKHLIVLISLCSLLSENSYSQYVDRFDMNKLVIQFEDASTEIVSGYIPLLYRLADTLNRNLDIQIQIRGHVCCVKRNKLAKQRAKAIAHYLTLFGVDPKRLTIKGFKNSLPVVFPEKSKDDELKNMRVDFVFTTNQVP